MEERGARIAEPFSVMLFRVKLDMIDDRSKYDFSERLEVDHEH